MPSSPMANFPLNSRLFFQINLFTYRRLISTEKESTICSSCNFSPPPLGREPLAFLLAVGIGSLKFYLNTVATRINKGRQFILDEDFPFPTIHARLEHPTQNRRESDPSGLGKYCLGILREPFSLEG